MRFSMPHFSFFLVSDGRRLLRLRRIVTSFLPEGCSDVLPKWYLSQRIGGGMYKRGPKTVKRKMWAALTFEIGFPLLAMVVGGSRSVNAAPLPGAGVRALPAFARKYGMPCSSCHQAWPMLSPFGQS